MANSLYNLGHRCHIYDNVGSSNVDNIDCIIGGETYHSAAISPPSGFQFSGIATGFGWSCGLVVGGLQNVGAIRIYKMITFSKTYLEINSYPFPLE